MAVMAMGVSGPATAFAATPASCPPAVSTGGGTCVSGPVHLTLQEQTMLNLKTSLAQEYAGVRAGRISFAQYQRDVSSFMARYAGPIHPVNLRQPLCVINPNTGQCVVASGQVSLYQQPQQTTYYCGPATASEVLGVWGVNVSQKTLAGNAYLQTDSQGQTSWSPSVMAPTLNTLTKSSFYVAVNGSGVGGGFSETTWIDDLMADIGWNAAIAGNIVEQPGTNNPHLNGHPTNIYIYHWIGIYGFTSYGAYTKYADSVSGTHGLFSWAGNVPAYSQLDSGSMTTLLNQRGFVW